MRDAGRDGGQRDAGPPADGGADAAMDAGGADAGPPDAGTADAGATCFDGVRNGTETDTDCGFIACLTACRDGESCTRIEDCESSVCTGGTCAEPSCTDLVRNGTETDVDCGGRCPTGCAPERECSLDADCASRVCRAFRCVAPTCTDMLRNGEETDVDCGGSGACPRCLIGRTCAARGDCAAATDCVRGVCERPTCTDTVQNGDETDVDCGGSCGTRCEDTRMCVRGSDCRSGVCDSTMRCAAPTCADMVQNGGETDVDCGGVGTCPRCAEMRMCTTDSDCTSRVCGGGVCRVPACDDRVINGMETDVDCGGATTCMRCAEMRMCVAGSDCTSGVCDPTLHCAAPGCMDRVRNGGESDVDCGGATTCLRCPDGRACTVAGDCTGGICTMGMCDTMCPPRLDPIDDGSSAARRALLISEIDPGDYIELYNDTDAAIDLAAGTYQLCSPFSYFALAGSGVTVPARGFATIAWPAGFTDTDAGGEVILYTEPLFGNPGSIMDFVCWGTNPHSSRKLEAESGNKWMGPCAAAITGMAIHRLPMTDGLDAGDYDVTSPPSRANCAP